ncbi:MAG: hypothetical protein R3F62_16240 [Planctomycetota bacterium]
MKRPLAYRHLARIYEMVGVSSVARVAVDRGLFPSPELERLASEDTATEEEVLALARDRGWTLPEAEPYRWGEVGSEEVLTLPRLVRVLDRDVFELDELGRTTDDDEVASLAVHVRQERRALLAELDRVYPGIMLPGAK